MGLHLCQALTHASGSEALLVLDPSTGESSNIAISVVTPATKPSGTRLTPMNLDDYAKA
jgi:hypothetical protein